MRPFSKHESWNEEEVGKEEGNNLNARVSPMTLNMGYSPHEHVHLFVNENRDHFVIKSTQVGTWGRSEEFEH